MNKELILEKLSKYGILVLLFLPLFVYNEILYPFVFLKGIIFRIVIELLFIIAIYLLFKNKFYKIPKDKIILALVAFLVILPITSLFTVNGGENWFGNFERMEGGFYYWHLLIYFLLLLNYLRTNEIWKKVFFGISISTLLIDIFALAQRYNIDLGMYNYPGRIGGTLGNAAYLASALLVASILVAFFFYKYKKYRIFSGAVIFLNIFTIFVSATRGTILALGIVVFLAFIISLLKKNFLSKKSRSLLASLFLVFILSVSSIFIFKNSSFIQNIEPLRRMASISLTETTSESRLVIWGYALQAWIDKPVIGWGIENFDMAFNKYFDHSIGEEWFDRAHNNYLDILVTGGLVSFIVYLSFILLVFKFIYNLYKKVKIDFISWQIFTLGWLAYLIQNFFIFENLNTLIFLFPFLSLLVFIKYNNEDIYQQKYNLNLNKSLTYLFGIIILVLTIFAFNSYIIQPFRANVTAVKAYRTFVKSDFIKSQELLNSSLEITQANYGTNDILIEFYKALEPEIKDKDFSNLNWAINVFEANDLDIRNEIKLISLHISGVTQDFNLELIEKDIVILNELLVDNLNRRALYHQLGQLYALKGDKEASIDSFKYALEIKSDKKAFWNLAIAYLFLEDNNNFLEQMQILIDGDYDLNIDELKFLANHFNKVEDNQTLEKIFFKVLEIDRSADNLADLAIIELRLEKTEEAIKYAKEAVELNPDIINKIGHLFNNL